MKLWSMSNVCAELGPDWTRWKECLKNIFNSFEFMTKKRHPYISFGGLLKYILQHALAKFQPSCNSQNTSQNTTNTCIFTLLSLGLLHCTINVAIDINSAPPAINHTSETLNPVRGTTTPLPCFQTDIVEPY